MPMSPVQIGRIYRASLQKRLLEDNGTSYFDKLWLCFSNQRYLVLYSKYHAEKDYFFYGIDIKYWNTWRQTDKLIFLLPPKGYDEEVAQQIKYLELSSKLSLDLIKASRVDLKRQKKITISIKSGFYDINDAPFIVDRDFIKDLPIDYDISRDKNDSIKITEKQLHKNISKTKKTTSGKNNINNKYYKLYEYLNNIDQSQKQIVLTFEEIKAISEMTLPQSAYKEKTWWNANLRRKLSDTNWEIQNIYIQSKQVVLQRKGTDFHNQIRVYVKNLLEGIPTRNILDPYTLQEWLNYCRRLGWFHEGTVLFEKSGIDIDKLSNTLQYEIEEHYQVCKREINRTRNLEILENNR